jgi:nucleotide-binding universal stress UspA family protein
VLWVVSVQDVLTERRVPADWPGAIEDLIDRHAELLAGSQDVHGRVTYGRPREELVTLGTDVDLLIVGSRDYGPIGRLVHGSVSRYLVRHAPCPLLVLPRGTAEVNRRPRPSERSMRYRPVVGESLGEALFR